MKNNFIYDIETYPNIFTMGVHHHETGDRWLFEISHRKNDITQLRQLIAYINSIDGAMVGYNNESFDYPIIHHLATTDGAKHVDAYNMCQRIIERNERVMVWSRERLAKQIDIFKIPHFDNKGVSLKLLEFNMGMESIQDLPFEPGTILTEPQIDDLISYMWHDIDATELFFIEMKGDIDFREELSKTYKMDCTNFNDTKIGEKYFIQRLEQINPDACYVNRQMRQTIRDKIVLKDAIFDYVYFEQPEFNRILAFFKSKVLTETKSAFNGLSALVEGFNYDFGTGGIHGSIESQTVYSDHNKVIIDLDVASYYPNLSIANNIYPEHLGELFCEIYKDVYETRKTFPKGSRENALFKLALNGTYGKSNSKWSPMFDSLYTMKITINGQLLLCMLAEQLIKIDGLEMIQVNTDGLTVRCPMGDLIQLQTVRRNWEKLTGLTLEDAIYKKMHIKDVNNYYAEYYNGKVKRKGSYEYDLQWHQNYSQKIVAKVTEKVLMENVNIEETIKNWPDTNDFFLRTKVKRSDNLMWGDDKIQKISRFYVSKNGRYLIKHSPPKVGYKIGDWKKASGVSDEDYFAWNNQHDIVPHNELYHTKNQSKIENRETAICKGFKVEICNHTTTIDRNNINYDYYINEVLKLVKPVRGY